MIVRNSMTENPITVQEDTSISEAQRILKERHIRKLPVMRGETLVGIVTDRDLREVTPSKATSLDVYELHYLLAKLTVKEAMTPNPITIGPDESVSRAALLMQENRIESLPVVENGKLIGIVTESDIFASFVRLTGIKQGGIEIGVEVPDEPGSLKDVADVIRERGLKIFSILCSYEGVPNGSRHVWFRIEGENALKQSIIDTLQSKYKILDVSKG